MRKHRPFTWFAFALVLCAGIGGAQTGYLHPGTLSGTITLTGETIESGWVQLRAPSEQLLASTNLSGPAYSLTVEGDLQWRSEYLQLYLADEASTETLVQIWNWSDAELVLVPAYGSASLNLDYPTARVDSSITLLGGTVEQVHLTATWSGLNGQFMINASYPPGPSYSLPVLEADPVKIVGTVSYVTPDGATGMRALAPRSLAVGSGGASLSWTIDLSQPETTIAGEITVEPAALVASHRVMAQGVWGTPTQGLTLSTPEFPANGPYSLGLVAGPFLLSFETRFTDGDFLSQGRDVVLSDGETSVQHLDTQLGFLEGEIAITGFVGTADVDWSLMGVRTDWNLNTRARTSPSPGDSSYGFSLSPGTWYPEWYDFGFSDMSDPAGPWSSILYRYDWGFGPEDALSVLPAQTTLGPDIAITTVQGEIVLDVVEALGDPETIMEYPIVRGQQRLFESGIEIGYKEFSGYSWAPPSSHAAVRFLAEPGTYTVYPAATIGGMQTNFAPFTLTVGNPAQTPVGTNVVVEASGTTTVTFGTVTAGGVTTSTQVPIGPEPPANFTILSPAGTPIYYDIETTAEYLPPILICIEYDPAGLLPAEESQLRLQHFIDPPGAWADITAPGSPDVEANTICGTVASFAMLAIMVPAPSGGHLTGGGWFNSPAGAWAADPSATGKATFGIVAKSDESSVVPTGQTEIQFHAPKVNFHSTAYAWLSVAGNAARYEGTGTINGAGAYRFMVSVVDGNVEGGDGVDRIRVMIWDGATLVYDSERGTSGSDATAPLGGGSIVIHKEK